MKIKTLLFILITLAFFPAFSQTNLSSGQQPQLAVDSKGFVSLVFGEKNKIYYSTSNDKGRTFTKPVIVGEVNEMHLGMTRGPQLAVSKDFSIISAMDKKGNIHSFRLTHRTGKWEKIQNVNDVNSSAPEGLMSLAADDDNNFYAVWLDLREGGQNNICFSTLKEKSGWSKNRFVYKSPEGHVCECCKPSIAVKGTHVSLMFRNWLKGARDCYLMTSLNDGKTFTDAQKMGNGTWMLKACPMDGGSLTIDSNNNIHTAWRREGQVYYAEPGNAEEKIGVGRSVGISGYIVYWQKGPDLIFKRRIGEEQKIGEGTALQLCEFDDNSILAVWEKDNEIIFKKI